MENRSERWQKVIPECDHLVMWGAGDQGRVNRPILESLGCKIEALVDDTPGLVSPFKGVPLFRGQEELVRWLRERTTSRLGFVVAIGNPFGDVRCRLHDVLSKLGLAAVSFSDPTALLCRSAQIEPGLQVMPGAIVHNEAVIGRQCILNTRSLVEHDCVLEEGVEIGPGATLAGRVHVGANTWIGTGASVRPRIRIGRNSIVGAGAVVVSDIPDDVIAVGVPAKPMADRTPSSVRSTAQS